MKLDIVATLGPASEDKNIIKKIIDGVYALRLNGSHLNKKSLKEKLDKLEMIFKEIGKEIPVIVDLKGAKIRIGRYPKVKKLPNNVTIQLLKESKESAIIPLNSSSFFKNIKVGMKLFLNDAKVILEVKNIENNKIECNILKNGSLSSNKGINIKNHPIPYNKITDFDRDLIEISNQYSFTYFAFSFVHTGDEADLLKKITSKKIVAKVERGESLEFLDNIDKKFDGIWFCRGDLGAQIGIENLGKAQYDFIKKIPLFKSDIYLAGEVLYHLTDNDTPTRTEITQLYMLEKKGFKGFVLSDETAIGKDPVNVINFLKRLTKSE